MGYEQEGRCERDDCQGWDLWGRGMVRRAGLGESLMLVLSVTPSSFSSLLCRYSHSFHSHAGWWRVGSWRPWSSASPQGCGGSWTHARSTCTSSMTVCCCLGPESQWLEWGARAQGENGRRREGRTKGTGKGHVPIEEPFSVAHPTESRSWPREEENGPKQKRGSHRIMSRDHLAGPGPCYRHTAKCSKLAYHIFTSVYWCFLWAGLSLLA